MLLSMSSGVSSVVRFEILPSSTMVLQRILVPSFVGSTPTWAYFIVTFKKGRWADKPFLILRRA